MAQPDAYRGRFAPSPTGPLHAGSLVAALASWLDTRVHGGSWLIRIEDVDTARCVAGMDHVILQQLATCGLNADEPVQWQSRRSGLYDAALTQLQAADLAYPCACTRSDIESALQAGGAPHQPGAERVYPGTCQSGLRGRPARAWRMRAPGVVSWVDRLLGPQTQDLGQAVGDFVLARSDGSWTYQLAVVVDDAAQGVSHVVRGLDLADNTARQMHLQAALRVPTPAYLHTPLVLAADGRKLSKQNGARALDLHRPVQALQAAAQVLGMPPVQAGHVADWLAQAQPLWAGMMAALSTRSPM